MARHDLNKEGKRYGKDVVSNPAPVPSPDAVRVQVKQMSGHQTEEEMAESLPVNTMALESEETAPVARRKRRTKEEMARARGEVPAGLDPNFSDPKYVKALKDMQAFGGSSIVKGGFDVAALAMRDPAIKLQEPEEDRLDGYFYVMSKKYNVLDPTAHWFTMALYFFGLLGSFVFTRLAHKKGNEMIDQLTRWFGGKDEEAKEDHVSAA
jgi:hypothetical protein